MDLKLKCLMKRNVLLPNLDMYNSAYGAFVDVSEGEPVELYQVIFQQGYVAVRYGINRDVRSSLSLRQ